MRYPTTPHAFRRRRLIVASIATAVLLTAFVTYSVLVHRGDSPVAAAPTVPQQTPGDLASVETKPVVVTLPALPTTSDPANFARHAAEAIFEWDTATLLTRVDHIEQLLAVADPTGESTPGLLSDLGNYLPTGDAWVELATYETQQWLSIDSVTTPTRWADAQAQAGDELLPGTTAYTIHGIRNRTGVWDGAPVASEHDVAFTVFIVCGPAYPECHLLRLSMLDNPLD
jgi:hypothetical protein